MSMCLSHRQIDGSLLCSCCRVSGNMQGMAVQVGLAEPVDKALRAMRTRVTAEVITCGELEFLQGMLEPLLTASLGKA